MKYRMLCAVLVLVMVFGSFIGCDQEDDKKTPTQTDVQSVVANPTNKPNQIMVNVPVSEYWTWNNLYDYLENPKKDSNWTVANGDYFVLFDTDHTTTISKWSTRLTDNMMVIQYNDQDQERYRFFVHLTGHNETVSTVPMPNQPSSKPTSSVKPSSSTVAPPSKPNSTVTTVTLQAPAKDAGIKQAVKDFNKQSKTVHIQLESSGSLLTTTKLSGAMANNTNPDFFVMNTQELTYAAGENLLFDLSSLGFDRLELLFDKECQNKLTSGTKRYTLLLGATTSCIARNEDIAYSCQLGDLPIDYDQMLDQAKMAKQAVPGLTPLGVVTNPEDATGMVEEFSIALWSLGGELLTPDQLSAAFYSLNGVTALEHLQGLQQDDLLGENVKRNHFWSRPTAFGLVDSTQYETTFGSQAKANYAPMPLVTPGNTNASPIRLYGFAVAKNVTKNEQAAITEFLNFYYASPAYSVSTCKSQGWIPGVLSARQDEYYQTPAWQLFIDAIDTAKPLPTTEGYQTVKKYLAAAIDSVLQGGDPEVALKDASEKTNARLNRE